ncbi:hypothetical protein [Amycolatopsis kentuckyensis]|uniref:hypothetical protein n=1 Tax=Amycolatopsis kentuckyensis TaxID=218823 RepID=UPI0035629815
MESTTTTVQIFRTTYTNDGETIGEVFAVPTHGRTLHLAFAHDWNGESPTGVYDPICCDTYYEQEAAAAEIERRAREAQAPTSLPDVRELPRHLADTLNWCRSWGRGVDILWAAVGDALIVCNPEPPGEQPALLVIDTPHERRQLRAHDGDVESAARMVAAAIVLANGRADEDRSVSEHYLLSLMAEDLMLGALGRQAVVEHWG